MPSIQDTTVEVEKAEVVVPVSEPVSKVSKSDIKTVSEEVEDKVAVESVIPTDKPAESVQEVEKEVEMKLTPELVASSADVAAVDQPNGSTTADKPLAEIVETPAKKVEIPSEKIETDELVVEEKVSKETTAKVESHVMESETSDGKTDANTKVDTPIESMATGERKEETDVVSTSADESPKIPVDDSKTNEVSAMDTESDAVQDCSSSVTEPSKDPSQEITSSESDVKSDALVAVSNEGKSAEESVSSEATAKVKGDTNVEFADKPVATDNELTSTSSPVTGSEDVLKMEPPQDGGGDESKQEEKPSGTSSEKESTSVPPSETTSEADASSSTPKSEEETKHKIHELRRQGLTRFIQKDFCGAADAFAQVLEIQAPLYGEMSEKLAETYFLYGSAMYEFGKSENTVLGEKVAEQEAEDDDDDDEEDDESEEKMEVDNSAEALENGEKADTAQNAEPSSEGPADESTTENLEDDKDDDDSFRVAWEMLELAKTTFKKGDNKKRLADTLMKLGEVGIETGNVEAIEEMVQSLYLRKEIFPENHRIIPETHFNIGVAYAFFEKYDEAVTHFTEAKKCLENRIASLSKSEDPDDKNEVEEMKQLLPEIQDKVQDTLESRADKQKIQEKASCPTPEISPFPAASTNKPISNISHLIKRKRVDEILPERAAKQSRQDSVSSSAESVPSGTKSSLKTAEAIPLETKSSPRSAEVAPVEVASSTSEAPPSVPKTADSAPKDETTAEKVDTSNTEAADKKHSC